METEPSNMKKHSLAFVLLLAALLQRCESSYPEEGSECTMEEDNVIPFGNNTWMQNDGLCCSCIDNKVQCEDVSNVKCPKPPENTDGCHVFKICKCQYWWLCNEDGIVKREIGLNNDTEDAQFPMAELSRQDQETSVNNDEDAQFPMAELSRKVREASDNPQKGKNHGDGNNHEGEGGDRKKHLGKSGGNQDRDSKGGKNSRTSKRKSRRIKEKPRKGGRKKGLGGNKRRKALKKDISSSKGPLRRDRKVKNSRGSSNKIRNKRRSGTKKRRAAKRPGGKKRNKGKGKRGKDRKKSRKGSNKKKKEKIKKSELNSAGNLDGDEDSAEPEDFKADKNDGDDDDDDDDVDDDDENYYNDECNGYNGYNWHGYNEYYYDADDYYFDYDYNYEYDDFDDDDPEEFDEDFYGLYEKWLDASKPDDFFDPYMADRYFKCHYYCYHYQTIHTGNDIVTESDVANTTTPSVTSSSVASTTA